MQREKEFIKSAFILSLGSFLPKAAIFITLPILTAYLSKSEYGTYDLIIAIVQLAIPVATLQIQSAAFRFLIDARGKKNNSSIIITNIASIVFLAALLLSFVIPFFFRRLSVSGTILFSWYLFFDALVITSGQVARGMGKNSCYSVASIIMAIVNIMGVISFVYYYKLGLKGVMLSLVIAQIVSLCYFAINLKLPSYLNVKLISLAEIKRMIRYSWPMVPNNLSVWALNLSDRLVVTHFMGIEANAIYAVANKIPSILSIGQSVMVMAWHENASLAIKDKDPALYYSKMLEKIYDLVLGGTGIIIAFTPLLFKILIKGEYSEAYFQMPLLILAMFFYVMSSFFGGIYIAHKKTVNVGISTMIAAAVNLLVDLCLIQVIGLWAASLSTLIAYALLYYYRMINVQRFQKIRINIAKELLEILLIVGMLFLCFHRKFIFNVINVILSVIVFILFNQKTILSFTYILKEKLEKYVKE